MDLLQGTLDVLILKTLSWDPMHGYAISRWIRQRTDNVLNGRRRRALSGTPPTRAQRAHRIRMGTLREQPARQVLPAHPAGRTQLRAEATEWRQYAEAVFKVLETA